MNAYLIKHPLRQFVVTAQDVESARAIMVGVFRDNTIQYAEMTIESAPYGLVLFENNVQTEIEKALQRQRQRPKLKEMDSEQRLDEYLPKP